MEGVADSSKLSSPPLPPELNMISSDAKHVRTVADVTFEAIDPDGAATLHSQSRDCAIRRRLNVFF